MSWRDLWPYARTWWGWTVAICTAVFAIYYGLKKMFETWDWYTDYFFDWKVRDFLEMSVAPQKIGSHGQILQWATPRSVQEIAAATRLSKWLVRGCLKRLKKKKEIVEDEKDFRIRI